MRLEKLLKILSMPLTLLFLWGIYFVLWNSFSLPEGDELARIASDFFNRYGLPLIFICSIIEGVFVVGNYFPGGLVIFLGVIAAGKDLPKAVLAVVVVMAGFFISHILNYFMGKYGWYRLLVRFGMKQQIETAEVRLTKHSFKAVMASFWLPNLAAITSTAAGVIGVEKKKFILEMAMGLVVWNIFWGALVWYLGAKALDIVVTWKYVLPVAFVWIVILLFIEAYKKRKGTIFDNE